MQGISEAQGQIRMVLERPLELLQMMRQSEVVRIQECNQLCVGKLDPAIASRRNAAVTLLERVQFPAISPCPIMYPLERPVAGAIINDDDLFREIGRASCRERV